jgi:ketosteroid isomerase-like protein
MPSDLELVGEIYDRFRAGDIEAALARFHPDIEIHERPVIPDPQVHRGHEGVLASLRESRSAFQGLDMVPEEFLSAGGHVIVVFRFQGKGRGSGIPIDERLAHLWTIRDGKVIRMAVYSGREEALRAAGALEAPVTGEGRGSDPAR